MRPFIYLASAFQCVSLGCLIATQSSVVLLAFLFSILLHVLLVVIESTNAQTAKDVDERLRDLTAKIENLMAAQGFRS